MGGIGLSSTLARPSGYQDLDFSKPEFYTSSSEWGCISPDDTDAQFGSFVGLSAPVQKAGLSYVPIPVIAELDFHIVSGTINKNLL